MMNSLWQTGTLACLFLGWVNTYAPCRSADLLLQPKEMPGGRKQMRLSQIAVSLLPVFGAALFEWPVFSLEFLIVQQIVILANDRLLYQGKASLRLGVWGLSLLTMAGVFFFWTHVTGGMISAWQLECAVLCIMGMSGFLLLLVFFTLLEWKIKDRRPGISIFLMLGPNALPTGLLSGHLYHLISQQQIPDSISLIFYLACYGLVLVFFCVFFFQRSRHRAWSALEEARQLAAMQEEYSQSLQRHARSLSAMQEDCARTARETADLVHSGQTEEAKKKLEALSSRIRTTRPALFTPSPIVNAILSQKKALCDSRDIVFEHELMLQERPGVEDLDLCIALGNLMDNAIRNADLMEGDKRHIFLSARIISGYLVINCQNPYRVENRGKIQHTGFGHQILQDLARRYNGTFESDPQDCGVFSATLSLACQEQPA